MEVVYFLIILIVIIGEIALTVWTVRFSTNTVCSLNEILPEVKKIDESFQKIKKTLKFTSSFSKTAKKFAKTEKILNTVRSILSIVSTLFLLKKRPKFFVLLKHVLKKQI